MYMFYILSVGMSADLSPQSILSFIALIYFILASGPSPSTRLLPWFIIGQLVLEGFIFVFWLSAAATSSYSCLDLCNVCGIADGYVYFDNQECVCYDYVYYKRNYTPKPGNVLQSRKKHSSSGGSHSTVGGSNAAKQAFDAIMVYVYTSKTLSHQGT